MGKQNLLPHRVHDTIRTCDPGLRRLVLYPAELHGLICANELLSLTITQVVQSKTLILHRLRAISGCLGGGRSILLSYVDIFFCAFRLT